MTTRSSRFTDLPDSHARAVHAVAMSCYGVRPPRIETLTRGNNFVFRLHLPQGQKILKMTKTADGATLLKELMLIRLLTRHAIPVPEVEHADPDGKVVGRPFFIMASAGEQTVADWVDKPGEVAGRLFGEMGHVLAAIHSITLDRSGDIRHDGIVPTDPNDFLGKLYEWADSLAREGLLQPAEADEFRSLQIPRVDGRQLCHSDFHAVQCIVRDEQIVAVVDWESAWAGNPAIDFAIAHGYLDYYCPPELTRSFATGYVSRHGLPADYARAYLPVRMVVALALMRAWHRWGPRHWQQAVERGKVARAIELYRMYARRQRAGTSDGSEQ